MRTHQDISLVGPAYADEARPWSSQETINWLPTQSEMPGARSEFILKSPPGFSVWADFGTGIVRGTYNCEGRRFAVIGTTLYQINRDGQETALGLIPGVGRVSFAHNQITDGNELLVVNGSAGYVYNTVTSNFQRITDEGYPGAIAAEFLDGYLIQIDPTRRFAFNSDLADAMDYNTLDRFTSEVSPDKLVGLASSNNELILFSERTAEFFENQADRGATQQPFRSKRITMDKGCAGRFTIAKLDNTVFWLGDDGQFYQLDGYLPRRVSTRPIEQAIRGKNWAQCVANVWEDSGYSVVYWTFPDGKTFAYDVSTGAWHTRKSFRRNNWRVGTLTRWGSDWYAGDRFSNRIFKLSWDEFSEAGEPMIAERTTGVTSNTQNRLIANYLELVMTTGDSRTNNVFLMDEEGDLVIGEGGDAIVLSSFESKPFAALRYSDDGGHNWSNWQYRDMGLTGEYQKRIPFNRLGSFRNRVWHIAVSSPNRRDLIAGAVVIQGTGG